MTLLGTIGMFGLGTLLAGELPKRKRRAELVSAALIACPVCTVPGALKALELAARINALETVWTRRSGRS